jgi:ribosome-binding protein aMBF1 (putative translation factor)
MNPDRKREIETRAAEAASVSAPIDWPAILNEIDARGLRASELARAVGTSWSALAALRSGRNAEPRDLLARRLLRVLDCLRGEVPHETYFYAKSSAGKITQ